MEQPSRSDVPVFSVVRAVTFTFFVPPFSFFLFLALFFFHFERLIVVIKSQMLKTTSRADDIPSIILYNKGRICVIAPQHSFITSISAIWKE